MPAAGGAAAAHRPPSRRRCRCPLLPRPCIEGVPGPYHRAFGLGIHAAARLGGVCREDAYHLAPGRRPEKAATAAARHGRYVRSLPAYADQLVRALLLQEQACLVTLPILVRQTIRVYQPRSLLWMPLSPYRRGILHVLELAGPPRPLRSLAATVSRPRRRGTTMRACHHPVGGS